MSSSPAVETLKLGPDANGALLTPEEFDAADFEEGWRYELIHGVLVVSPSPLREERDPNEELGHWLRNYQEDHPQGHVVDATLSEETIVTDQGDRRRIDRVIWVGLGRLPEKLETPSIAIEFVSSGKRNLRRDYDEKRDEFMAIGIDEYWIIDRFARTMTVFFAGKRRARKKVFAADKIYTTTLLPGFELPLDQLFELADRWGG